MMHKAWSSMEEVPYYFARSTVKFQGRTALKIVEFDPDSAFPDFKDRAHLSTFKIFIFEKFSCFIVLVVFLVIVQSSELVSVWFCEKNDIFS